MGREREGMGEGEEGDEATDREGGDDREEASWAEALAEEFDAAVAERQPEGASVSMGCAVDAEAAEQAAATTSVTDALREVEDALRNVGTVKLARTC